MIPENRVDNGSFPIPKLSIEKEDIALFMKEFKGFHAQFADCFSREEPRKNFHQYMAGQMSQLERKSIEPIALNVESAKVRAMQHFLSDIVWEEERILSRYHGLVSDDLGDAEGVLIFPEKTPGSAGGLIEFDSSGNMSLKLASAVQIGCPRHDEYLPRIHQLFEI